MHTKGLIFIEEERPDTLEIQKLLTRYQETRKIPLREILPFLKGSSFTVADIGGKKITPEDVERVIKEIVPHAIVHHVVSWRDEKIYAIKTPIPQKGLYPGDPVPALSVFINSNDDIVSIGSWFLPPMIKFTL